MYKIMYTNDGDPYCTRVPGVDSILAETDGTIDIEYNCRQGHCGRCILKLLNGDVMHKEHATDLRKGEILACRSRPVSDIRVAKSSQDPKA